MEKLQIQLEQLRREAAECLVLSNLTTDPEKRQLFANVAKHIAGLASAVASALAAEPANVVRAEDLKRSDAVAVDQKRTTRSRRMLLWSVVLLSIAATGAFVWPRPGKVKDPSLAILEAKAKPPPAQEDTTQVMANFLSTEEQKWKSLTEQLAALSSRIDNLGRARAEMAEPATERVPETTLEPTTKRDVGTLRRAPHRKTASSNSRRLRSGWGLFDIPRLRF